MGSQGTEGACAEIEPPFVVAHRAGNRLDRLREAERQDVALVEADVRLFHGRAEVRHLNTVGPLPIYWDRWTLASPFRRSLVLSELLRATDTGTELMLDLKGWRSRAGEDRPRRDRAVPAGTPLHDLRAIVASARRLRRAARPPPGLCPQPPSASGAAPPVRRHGGRRRLGARAPARRARRRRAPLGRGHRPHLARQRAVPCARARGDRCRRADQRPRRPHRPARGCTRMSVLGTLGDALDSASDRFGQLDGRFLLPALVLQLLTLVFRALAWRGVLVAAYPGRRVSALSVGGAYAAGVAMNAFTPARGGELAKVLIARTRIQGSTVPTLAASLTVVLVADALIGGLLVCALWATGVLPVLPAPPGPLAFELAAAGVAVAAGCVALAYRLRPEPVRRLARRAAQGLSIAPPAGSLRLHRPAVPARRVGVPDRSRLARPRGLRHPGERRDCRARRRPERRVDPRPRPRRRRHAAGARGVRAAGRRLRGDRGVVLARHAGRRHGGQRDRRSRGDDAAVPHRAAGGRGPQRPRARRAARPRRE